MRQQRGKNIIYNKNNNLVMEINIELREEQGGRESKILVETMADIYTKSANIKSIDCKTILKRNGFAQI